MFNLYYLQNRKNCYLNLAQKKKEIATLKHDLKF